MNNDEIKTEAMKKIMSALAEIREEVRTLVYTKPEKQKEKIEKIAEDLSILRDNIREVVK